MNVRAIIGACFILLGALLFWNRGATFGVDSMFTYFWASIFIIPIGLLFHWLYFSVTGRKGVGLLVPGGVIFTVGLVCQIAALTDGWSYLWPGFIAAPAIGLLELYWFGSRNRYLLIPVYILLGISLLFFIVFSLGTLFDKLLGQPLIAVVIVLIGVFLLLGKRKEEKL